MFLSFGKKLARSHLESPHQMRVMVSGRSRSKTKQSKKPTGCNLSMSKWCWATRTEGHQNLWSLYPTFRSQHPGRRYSGDPVPEMWPWLPAWKPRWIHRVTYLQQRFLCANSPSEEWAFIHQVYQGERLGNSWIISWLVSKFHYMSWSIHTFSSTKTWGQSTIVDPSSTAWEWRGGRFREINIDEECIMPTFTSVKCVPRNYLTSTSWP